MTLQTVPVICRVCRAERTVTIDDSRPVSWTVTHYCRVCNRDRPLVVAGWDGWAPITTAEGSA